MSFPILLTTINTSPAHIWSTPTHLMDSAPPNHHSTTATSSPPMQSPKGSTNTTPSASTGLMGKHRMAAAISHLNQQIQIIQEELDLLETIGGASTVCPELISSIESVPDALLQETRGPVDVGWDRWFQGAQSSKSRRRWI